MQLAKEKENNKCEDNSLWRMVKIDLCKDFHFFVELF